MAKDRYAASKRRQALRKQAVEYKGGCCQICGYNACLAALDFHHTHAWSKEFNISSKMTSFKAIQAELDKCVLLCCRCHREVHDGLHPGYIEEGYEDYGGEDDFEE